MREHGADVGSETSSALLVAAPPALRTANRVVPGTPSFVVAAGSGSDLRRAVHSPLTPTAAYYMEAFGWPVVMNGEEISLVCGLNVDVLAMPAGLGGEVNNLIDHYSLYAPVIEHSGKTADASPRWMFLCASSPGGGTKRSLFHHGVTHLGTGATVGLPLSPDCESGRPRWVTRPRRGTNEFLPPWGAVYAFIKKAVTR